MAGAGRCFPKVPGLTGADEDRGGLWPAAPQDRNGRCLEGDRSWDLPPETWRHQTVRWSPRRQTGWSSETAACTRGSDHRPTAPTTVGLEPRTATQAAFERYS